MHAVCMHYPEGRDLQFPAQETLVYQSLLLPHLQTYLHTGKHASGLYSDHHQCAESNPTVKQGMGNTLKLKLTICSTGRKLHLSSRYWAEDRKVLQADAIDLWRAALLCFFFLIKLNQDRATLVILCYTTR